MANYHQPHICQCLTRLATLRRDYPATVCGHRRKSGPELAEGVLGLARGLHALGLGSGDVVAVAAFNSGLYLEWILAIAFVGGIVAPLNYRWSFEEAVFAMRAVRPVMLVTDESCRFWSSELRAQDLLSLRWRVSLDSSSSDCNSMSFDRVQNVLRQEFGSSCDLSHGSYSIFTVLTTETIRKPCTQDFSSDYSWAPENAVLICFTSGTTGRPKGVTISHSALIVQSLAKIAIVGYSHDDVYLHTAPLCHIGGLSSAISMLLVGACHVLIPKFEAKDALEAAKRHRVTSLIAVPAMMADLVSSARRNEAWKRIESVRIILNGGGGLSHKLIEEATKLFPRAKLFSAYGMTEACSSLTFMTLFDPTLRASDINTSMSAHKPPGVLVGKPAPHVEIKICVDDASSNAGKILTRGPHVMLRYWDQTDSHSLDRQWLDTGDIGFVDEFGDLWLLGRTNGRIKSGGENVYPEEVEAIVSQHPGILGVVAVGIPNARLTEMVVACVRVRRDWRWSDSSLDGLAVERKQLLSDDILQRFCGEKSLARFKIPKKFYLWKKPFPVTTTGKVLRQEVQREVVSQLQPLNSNL